MGHMMISLKKENEALLRHLANEEYGGKKGALSTVVEEALAALVEKKTREEALQQAIAHMRKGINIGLKGKQPYRHRSELYDRAGLPR